MMEHPKHLKKTLTAALVLAAFALPVQNASAYDQVHFLSLGTFTAPFTIGVHDEFIGVVDTDHIPGLSFATVFDFTLTAPVALTNSSVITQNLEPTFLISTANFTSSLWQNFFPYHMMANGQDQDFTTFAYSFIPTTILNPGDYQLRVSGAFVPGANSGSFGGNLQAVPIPEPGTFALLLAGLGVVGFMARRRIQNDA